MSDAAQKALRCWDMTGDVPRYRYVFDISDTGTRQNARTPFTWAIREENRAPIAVMLEKEYEVSANRGLAGQLEEIAMQKAMDYWQEHQDELRDTVDGSLLMEYDELNLELAFEIRRRRAFSICSSAAADWRKNIGSSRKISRPSLNGTRSRR